MLEGGTALQSQVANTNSPRLLVYSLSGKATLPQADTPVASQVANNAGAPSGSAQQITQGAAHYARFCARCHGIDAINTGPLKDLTHSDRVHNTQQWNLVVFAGLLGSTGMPGFMAELKPDDVEAVRMYVAERRAQLSGVN
jgi:quinohemoprotein ethanol dehydrogenase